MPIFSLSKAALSAAICLAATATTALLAQPAQAQDGASYGLTGDWGGLRQRLDAKGWDFQLGYTFEPAYNTSGGARRELDAAGQFAIGATADLSRLINVPTGKIQFTITHREGRNLSSDSGIGALQDLQEVYGRGNVWRIADLYYQQSLFRGALDVKLGRMAEGEDFAAFSCDFQNLTFCGSAPGNIAGDYWYKGPISQWGVRIKAPLGDQGYVQTAVYQIDPQITKPSRGFSFGSTSGKGVLVPLEGAWTPTLSTLRLPGSYKVGGWVATEKAPDVFYNSARQPLSIFGGNGLTRSGRYGGYINFQQQVTGAATKAETYGLTLFLNAVKADNRTSRIDRQIVVGATYVGLPGRPKDLIAFGFGATYVNDRVARGEALRDSAGGLSFVPIQGAEHEWELDYQAQVAPWLSLRPNLQVIQHPSGVASKSTAVVLGLKAGLAL